MNKTIERMFKDLEVIYKTEFKEFREECVKFVLADRTGCERAVYILIEDPSRYLNKRELKRHNDLLEVLNHKYEESRKEVNQ